MRDAAGGLTIAGRLLGFHASRKARFVSLFLIGVTLTLVLFLGSVGRADAAQNEEDVCRSKGAVEPSGKIELKLAEGDSSGVKIDFGSKRGYRSDAVTMDATPATNVELPDVLAATVVELRRGSDESIQTAYVAARRQGSRYVLQVCVDPRFSTKAGTYTGDALFSSKQVSSAPIPITVQLQTKLTEILLVGTVLTGALGVVWAAASIELSTGKAGAGPRIRKRVFAWRVVIVLVPAIGAAWLIWKNASQDQAFGRGNQAVIGHIGSQIAAAVAAATTAFGAKSAVGK